MRRIWNIMKVLGAAVLPLLVAVMVLVQPVFLTQPVMAETVSKDADGSINIKIDTNILPPEWASKEGVMKILGLILRVLVYGLGAAATLGVVIAGVMYLTARDDPQQAAKAKKRLIEIAIGLVAWAVLFTVLNWLIPGFDPTKIPS